MKAVMVMYDSLDKHFLQCYGCDWTKTPNFSRLAERTVRYDNFYVGSMPCMPARRELHTGRYCMLHRGWGPLEPFDDSMPELLKKHGVYTHLCTDHYHYFQDGGATYHSRFSSWEGFRGQEGDAWKGEAADPDFSRLDDDAYAFRKTFQRELLRHDEINRKYIREEADMPQSQTFAAGLEFIRTNHDQDNWFLDIETFDPHEPFFCRGKWGDLYPHEYHKKAYDWPSYRMADEDADTVTHIRSEYAALVSKCDDSLGKVLDLFDEYDLWKDTLLIVCTDHGFLLGEHQWWGKFGLLYQEVANTPFFIYDPRSPKAGRCAGLAQTIDIAPTLLEFFGAEIPADMQGEPLKKSYLDGQNMRDTALYGYFGSTLCLTDGQYTYMRAPQKPEIQDQYTLMPTTMDNRMAVESFRDAEMVPPFSFTKGARVIRLRDSGARAASPIPYDLLFDVSSDPHQTKNIRDYSLRAAFCQKMAAAMRTNDAPPEAYVRYGLDGDLSPEELARQEERRCRFKQEGIYAALPLADSAKEFLHAALNMLPPPAAEALLPQLEKRFGQADGEITCTDLDAFFRSFGGDLRPLTDLVRMVEPYFLQE